VVNQIQCGKFDRWGQGADDRKPRTPKPGQEKNPELKSLYQFSVLKRPSQKSLPSSLFQREESFLGIRWKIPLFPPLEKGDEGGFYGFSKD